MSEDTNLINLQLQLQNATSENTPESLSKALDALDTSIRRGVPEDKVPAILKLRGGLIEHLQKQSKIEQLKTELSQAPGRLDRESIVDLEQTPGVAGGPPSFTLPASETRQEIGRITSSAPLAGTGKHFAKAIVREPTSPEDLAPKRLSPDQIFRLNEAGLTNLIPNLQPPMGPAITAGQVQAAGEAGIPTAGITQASQLNPEQFQQIAANEAAKLEARKAKVSQADASLWVDQTGKTIPNAIGKTFDELQLSGGIRLMDKAEAKSLNTAIQVIGIGDEIRKLAPQILKKYGGVNLGTIFEVKGNEIFLRTAASAAGDPTLASFKNFLNDYLIRLPQAYGLSGAREGPRIIELFSKSVGNLGSTIESLNASLDANQVSIDKFWAPRQIKPSLNADWKLQYKR